MKIESPAARLALTLAVFLLLVAALNGFVAVVAPRHFLPIKKMDAALAQGDRCVVVIGDSRVEAGFDAELFRTALAAKGVSLCAVDLSLGGTRLPAQAVFLRQYLARGRRPAAVILGYTVYDLLEPDVPAYLDGFHGNAAVSLVWSRASDVFIHYPGFPRRFTDAGVRFSIARLTALQKYHSVILIKGQLLQSRLVGAPLAPRNRFGSLTDMTELNETLIRNAAQRAAGQAADAQWREHPWMTVIREELRLRNVPLIALELPMGSRFRAVSGTETAARYRAWLKTQLAADGGGLIDFSNPSWNSDDLFMDSIHMNGAGTRVFSRALAEAFSAAWTSAAALRRP